MPASPVQVDSDAFRKYSSLKHEYQALSGKLAELELELDEHRLVLSVLKSTDPARICHRLLGDVLVEQKVEAAIPILELNATEIQQVVTTVQESLERKEAELASLEASFSTK